ncbi:MAG: DUF6198 family protein [Erysipelotrichaceae bacterium]|jgi:uncharacterized membrane protein YczE|nr:DUF6198 family protein [Bacillota bacterium]NLP22571.1 hypothetical protein [Erysipelotrichaceae bacterium]HCY06678.1 hypothetical protein [Erysipelotrichaceae bacterium]
MTKRITIYSIGTIILAIGVVFSVIADLGTAPINMPILVISEIMNTSFGNATIYTYIVFIILQAVLMKKIDVKLLMQLPFSFVFGKLVDIIFVVFNFPVDTIIKKWICLFLGVVGIALGSYLCVRMNLIMDPANGATNEVAKKLNSEFGKVKIGFDISCVVVSVIVSFIVLKRIFGVGIGTLIYAILIGKAISLFGNLLNKHIEEY